MPNTDDQISVTLRLPDGDHVQIKPVLSKDGDTWCVSIGVNLQEGVSGFGSTPMRAFTAFFRACNDNHGTHYYDA